MVKNSKKNVQKITRTKKRYSKSGTNKYMVFSDSSYLLKVVLYLIIGSLWLRLSNPAGSYLPLPIGLIVGILFASHEHFQVDRKIEYVILALASFIGFWLPIGITFIL